MSHEQNGRKRRNLLEGSGYKSLRPRILISDKDYAILSRYVEAENNEHKASCEEHGHSFLPFDRDVLIGALISIALREWDLGQRKIEAAKTPDTASPASDSLDELREIPPFGPVETPECLQVVQEQGV